MASHIDLPRLLKDMLAAAEVPLKKRWPVARDYAENEFRKYLGDIQHIANLKSKGSITRSDIYFYACRKMVIL